MTDDGMSYYYTCCCINLDIFLGFFLLFTSTSTTKTALNNSTRHECTSSFKLTTFKKPFLPRMTMSVTPLNIVQEVVKVGEKKIVRSHSSHFGPCCTFRSFSGPAQSRGCAMRKQWDSTKTYGTC